MVKDEREKWLLRSTLLNAILAIAKLTFGSLTSTGVVIADGIHSLSDVINSLLIYVSIRLAGKKSRRFPFGMHKLEDFAALIGGFVILYAAFEIVNNVFRPEFSTQVKNFYFVIGFMLVILMSQALFAFFEYRSSKRLNSPGVQTDLMDWVMDMGSTIVAIVGIILSHYHLPYAQQVAVIIIVLIVLHGVFGILKDAVLTLLDASVDSDIIEQARRIIMSYPEVASIDTLFIRKAGSIFVADIILQIRQKNMDVAHEIVEKIEQSLKKEIEHLQIVTIHYEPVKKRYKKIAIFLTQDNKIAEKMRDVAKIIVKELDEEGRVLNSYEYENPYFENNKGHSIRLISWLIKQEIDEVVFHPKKMAQEQLELFQNLGIKVKQKLKLEW